MLERFFGLQRAGTTLRTEITAGFTTFAAMAYILAVNPQILSVTGMDFGAVVTATALAAAIMTAVFGLVTNWPIALAPGMGLNAFFAFTICGAMGVPWPAALAMVFCSGVCFLLLSLTGVRQRIIQSIPHEMKVAISCGIGLFIAFIGLQKGGVVVAHPATLITAGALGSPRVLLVLAGVVVAAVLHFRRVRGAIILSVLAVALAGLVVPGVDGMPLTKRPAALIAWPASLGPTFLKLDFSYLVEHFRMASGGGLYDTNTQTGGGVNNAVTTFLGTFTASSGAGAQYSISTQALVDFLNLDTNDTATFIVTSQSVQTAAVDGIRTKENVAGSGSYPKLTVVPEPASGALLLLAAGFVVGVRRGRGQGRV